MSGPGEVLSLIRAGTASTRGDLIERTGLSRMTIAQRVDALMSAGLLVEGSSIATGAGGRRRRSLRFNSASAHVLAISLDTSHARVAITDLSGRLVAEDRLAVSLTDGPSGVLDVIADAARSIVKQGAGPGATPLLGIGISIPGPVDPATGRPSQPPIMPGWDAYPIREHLGAAFAGAAVITANDADAAALGEWAAGDNGPAPLCLVKVSTGIGSGIVIDGRSFQGIDGGAGDIGHVRLFGSDEGLPCHCGGHGCLATVASGEAVARELSALGKPASSGADVGALLAVGDADAVRLTQEAGRRIGEVMSTVVCVLNPGVVVFGGDLASSPLLSGVRESLYRHSLPRATRHLTLQLGRLGADAPLVGLARFVVDQELSSAAVDERLS